MNGHGIIMTIILGLVIGLLARLFKPGADPLGWILTIVLGIVGAWVGGMLVPGGGVLWWVASIIAAIVLLFIYEMIRGRSARPRV